MIAASTHSPSLTIRRYVGAVLEVARGHVRFAILRAGNGVKARGRECRSRAVVYDRVDAEASDQCREGAPKARCNPELVRASMMNDEGDGKNKTEENVTASCPQALSALPPLPPGRSSDALALL
jgi:hypothetical protein